MAEPCQACGACCTSFRVSFYWGEGDDAPGGTVPAGLTEPVSPHLRCMIYDRQTHRCIALSGEVGRAVSCNIYPLRSSTCREFYAYDEQGLPDPACNRARARHGLPPLEMEVSG